MKKPVIYLYTQDGITEVLVKPMHLKVISRDNDAYTENGEGDQKPLSKKELAKLKRRNDAFDTNFTALLQACRKLVYHKADQHEEGFEELSALIDKFARF